MISCLKKAASSLPTSVLLFFSLDFALAFLYLLNLILGSPSLFLTQFVSLDTETNLPTWYSSIQLFVVAQLFFLRYFQETWSFNKRGSVKIFCLFFCAIFLLLSLDEMAEIHEKLGHRADHFVMDVKRTESSLPQTGVWMFVIGVPFTLFMLVAVFLLRYIISEEKGVFRKMIIGMFIFFGSALGIEYFSNFVDGPGSTSFHAQIFFEELGEMIGVTFFLWAAHDLVFVPLPHNSPFLKKIKHWVQEQKRGAA